MIKIIRVCGRELCEAIRPREFKPRQKMIKIFSAREGGELAKLLLQGRAYTPVPVFPYKKGVKSYGI